MTGAPEKPGLDGLEATWGGRWADSGIYDFDASASRERVFSIDTPPPTVSGSLHVGHVFSYTQTDCVARYRRMRGFSVWYPMGWDDNGLPTERRVQNYYGVMCDPTLPYQPGLIPPAEGGLAKGQTAVHISRPNFVELCETLTAQDEKAFEQTWRNLGLSVDWRHTYATIDTGARRTSQLSFLKMLERGDVYSAEAPTLWDVEFKTAVAQAELEDRERPGAHHTLVFTLEDGTELLIDTTRPELLPACVAVVAHPEDERYKKLFGSTVRTPLFKVPVPVVAHPLAQPDKGTGIAMICTFGDLTDVIWWRELRLPVRAIVGREGRLVPSAPQGLDETASQLYETELAGRGVSQAQRRIVELLAESGDMRGEPRPITHAVKFFEKGDRPLEIVTSRQWFVKTVELRDALIERGRQLTWHPPYMRARYEDWVSGLNGDWLISRQRFFGVPFPVWYPLGPEGDPDHSRPLIPSSDRLPIDPTTDVPEGYEAVQRDVPGGFTADPDVMDTWATSSLTPQIAGRWAADPELWSKVFPMDMRPQAHDIIRTWLFSTVVRSHLEHDCLPWSNVALSGWILDPDRKKMSKSKGNVVTPQALLDTYGSDAVRYWAASGRPGTDTAFDEGQMKVGRKLAIKILNASRFVLGSRQWSLDGDEPSPSEAAARALEASIDTSTPTEAVDRALLRSLRELVETASSAFDSYDYARALEKTEAFFWDLCDNYLELVKQRAAGQLGEHRAVSARVTLARTLAVLLRLFAPFMPFVTEEVWSWWHPSDLSVHTASWPDSEELISNEETTDVYLMAVSVLAELRRAKTAASLSPRSQVESLTVRDSKQRIETLRQCEDDIKAAQNVSSIVWEIDENANEIHVVLGDQPS